MAMDAEIKLNKILTQMQKLNKLKQGVCKKKSPILNGAERPETVKLIEVSVLGADLWHGMDIDKYVDEERQW